MLLGPYPASSLKFMSRRLPGAFKITVFYLVADLEEAFTNDCVFNSDDRSSWVLLVLEFCLFCVNFSYLATNCKYDTNCIANLSCNFLHKKAFRADILGVTPSIGARQV